MQDIYQTFEFSKIQESIKEFSKTELGRLKTDSLKMFDTLQDVRESLLDLEEMISIVSRFGVMPIATSANALFLIDMAKKTALLTPRDLNLIADDVITSQNIIKYFNKIDISYPRLKSKVETFNDLSSLEKEIHRVITSSLTISDKASPELKQIRDKLRRLEASLQQKIASISLTYSKYLNDTNATIREGHFVLPVKTIEKSRVPGIIYDISDSGATTFIEPMEVVQLNNEITTVKVEENEEIRKILKGLTSLVLLQEREIIHNNAIIGELDFLIAKSLYSNNINGVVSEVSDEPYLDLLEARHPLIDSRKVVANSYHLDNDKRIIIISGPNAGGKTVSLKTVGLLTLMNQCGLAVPAIKAKIGFFKNIYIDIGDNQSLSDNLSTFSAHMNQIGEITQKVGGKDLVLIDELGTGTDPKEGEALALSIIKYLEKKNCLAMISSHFSALKEYGFVSEHIINSSMVFDEEKLSPTYRFRQGVPGMSYALDVANRYGICEEIVANSRDFIAQKNTSETSELIILLQKKLDEANKLIEESNRKKKELDVLSTKLENDEKVIRERRERLLDEVKEEKQQIIDKAREDIEEIIKEINKDGMLPHEVAEIRRKINELEDAPEDITYDEEIHSNDYVEIPSLNISGRVIRINNAKAHVVSDEGLSFDVNVNKLHKISAPKKTQKKKTSSIDFAIDTKVGLELNIIGIRAEEAQNELIKYIDTCRLRHFKQVRIIHGFGEGILRKMVRSYLDTQKDLTYRAGDGSEGGGGATVVIFK